MRRADLLELEGRFFLDEAEYSKRYLACSLMDNQGTETRSSSKLGSVATRAEIEERDRLFDALKASHEAIKSSPKTPKSQPPASKEPPPAVTVAQQTPSTPPALHI